MRTRALGVFLVPLFALPASLSAREVDDATLAGEIEACVKGLVAADEFSGAVIVARGEAVVFQGAFGLASRAFRAPNQVDTRFNLGSMNKMFTAVAISQLAQRGKLDFEHTVGMHIPDWPNAAVLELRKFDRGVAKITGGPSSPIRHMRSHVGQNGARVIIMTDSPLYFPEDAPSPSAISKSSIGLIELVVDNTGKGRGSMVEAWRSR